MSAGLHVSKPFSEKLAAGGDGDSNRICMEWTLPEPEAGGEQLAQGKHMPHITEIELDAPSGGKPSYTTVN